MNAENERNERKSEKMRITITEKLLGNILRNMSNWKAPDPNDVQGFYLKNVWSMHYSLQNQLQKCFKNA